jgi:hypothetical protein
MRDEEMQAEIEDFLEGFNRAVPDNLPRNSDAEASSPVVLLLPDNRRDPELTQALRDGPPTAGCGSTASGSPPGRVTTDGAGCKILFEVYPFRSLHQVGGKAQWQVAALFV